MQWKNLLTEERVRSAKKHAASSDLRSEFEKDYHRIIGSASFRRLQDKAQVFPLDRGDYVRTRLTHSLEVASFGRSLGQNIGERIIQEKRDETFLPQYKEDICNILQCAGLIHDIGNPPFGHFGETAIRDWFMQHLPDMQYRGKRVEEMLLPQMKEDFYHFEGNTQALRVVAKLHFLIDHNGMNLTKALLGTIIKYPVSSLDIDKKSGDIRTKKMGYYYADQEVFADIQESTGTNGKRHPLAFVLEAADDIAYKTADIEDAIKKGCLSYDKLLRELKQYGAGEADNQDYMWLVKRLETCYERAINRKVDKPDEYAVQNWIVSVQGKMIACATEGFMTHYDAIMEGTWKQDLFAETTGNGMMWILGDIAYRYVFLSKPILKQEIGAQVVFESLLLRFTDAVLYMDTDEPASDLQKKLRTLLSDHLVRIYEICADGKSEEEKLYLRLLLVTDYICGMTDGYARKLYQELNAID